MPEEAGIGATPAKLGSLGFDQGADLALELGGPAGAAADLEHELAGHPLQPDHAVQRASRDLQLGPEVVQVPAQPALVLRAGFDQVLAMIEQELYLQGVLVEVGGGQGLRALAQGCPGDRQGVDRVRLTRAALTATAFAHQLRGDAHHALS